METRESYERYILSKARPHLNDLTNMISYRPHTLITLTKESIMAGFGHLGFGDYNIQLKMFEEFMEFACKHINETEFKTDCAKRGMPVHMQNEAWNDFIEFKRKHGNV